MGGRGFKSPQDRVLTASASPGSRLPACLPACLPCPGCMPVRVRLYLSRHAVTGVLIRMRFPARGSGSLAHPGPVNPGQVLLCFRAVVGRHTAVVHLMHARTNPSVWYVALRTTVPHASTHTHASHGCHKSWGTNVRTDSLITAHDFQNGTSFQQAARLLGTFRTCTRWKAQVSPFVNA